MSQKVTLQNGLSYDAVPEVAAEVKALRDEVTKLKGDAQTAATAHAQAIGDKDKEIEKLRGERDGFKAKADAAEEEKKLLPQKIKDAAKARLELVSVATRVLSEDEAKKLDGMDEKAIKTAVVQAKNPKMKLDSVSEAYIDGVFDSIVAGLDSAEADEAIADSRAAAAHRQDGNPAADSQDAARGRMIARMKGEDKKK